MSPYMISVSNETAAACIWGQGLSGAFRSKGSTGQEIGTTCQFLRPPFEGYDLWGALDLHIRKTCIKRADQVYEFTSDFGDDFGPRVIKIEFTHIFEITATLERYIGM